MAKEDLFELATMLRMQLPILLSFATLRWTAGLVVGGVGGRLLRRIGMQSLLKGVVSDLHQVRCFLYITLLGTLVAAWLGDRRSNSTFFAEGHVCAAYDTANVQGLACAAGVLVLITNGSALALALALATFKAVADLSITSVSLAVAAVSVALAPEPSLRHKLVVGAGLGAHWASCPGGSADDRSGGAVLGLAFLLLHGCMRAAAAAWRFGARCATRWWKGLFTGRTLC